MHVIKKLSFIGSIISSFNPFVNPFFNLSYAITESDLSVLFGNIYFRLKTGRQIEGLKPSMVKDPEGLVMPDEDMLRNASDFALVTLQMGNPSGRVIRVARVKRVTFTGTTCENGCVCALCKAYMYNHHGAPCFSFIPDQFGLLGGTLGLFTGISVLSFLEVIFWIWVWMTGCCIRTVQE